MGSPRLLVAAAVAAALTPLWTATPASAECAPNDLEIGPVCVIPPPGWYIVCKREMPPLC